MPPPANRHALACVAIFISTLLCQLAVVTGFYFVFLQALPHCHWYNKFFNACSHHFANQQGQQQQRQRRLRVDSGRGEVNSVRWIGTHRKWKTGGPHWLSRSRCTPMNNWAVEWNIRVTCLACKKDEWWKWMGSKNLYQIGCAMFRWVHSLVVFHK